MEQMSKIHNFPEKTALEVEDTDLIPIEDEEDTKKITIKELKEVMRSVNDEVIKTLINETLDKIADAILASKWEIRQPIIKSYRMNTWIGSASGNIQIALLDEETNKWLTDEEITVLFDREPETFSIETLINHTYEVPVSWDIRNFNEEHEFAHDINAWMSDDDAGFLKIHFDDLTQNEISQIIYEDIKIHIDDEINDEGIVVTKYLFHAARDSFANSVPYESEIPFECPCQAAQRGDG